MDSLSPKIRHDWTLFEVERLFNDPFNDLLFQAHTIHRSRFEPNVVQLSTLVSIQTGGCPEDCAYCPQSIHHRHAQVDVHALMSLDELRQKAKQAKVAGASRLCMGAAWRHPKDRDFSKVLAMVGEVKAQGLEACATLGMLNDQQSKQLKQAGLDYYNHNLDTSEDYYQQIITTRCYQDRLDTLRHVRDAGIGVCCGGIVGLGETLAQRASLLQTLATLKPQPESVPINRLVAVPGTPLEDLEPVDPLAFIRTIAVARIVMPASVIRLSAGREQMSDEMQALCFFAGANSIFYGEQLLTTTNPETDTDQALFKRLGLQTLPAC